MKRYVHDYDMVIPVYSDTEDADGGSRHVS